MITEITIDNYDESLRIIEELMDAEPNTPEGDELSRLADLVIDYENLHWPFDNQDV